MNDSPTIDDSLPTPPPPRREDLTQEGETFQHYQVLRRPDGRLWELGRGAMGVTYKAFDTNLRCHVALKVISADYIHSETAGQRFVREARVAARLRHPNVASVYHLGVDPQGFFYSMEFIDGENLEDMVARVGPLPLETVLHVGLQVARALAAAARQGLIHRDIKPANVMVLHENEEGDDRLTVKVIDFGLARSYAAEDSAPQLTATGFVGTPLFSSPEQLEEQDLDVRSDIYSLGVTLWILLTGRPPFEGKMTQVITQHLHAPPPWWQLPACPEPVRLLLEKMLQKNRLQRFQSAGELRTAIENCLRAVTTRADLLLAPAAEGSDPGGAVVPPAARTSVAPLPFVSSSPSSPSSPSPNDTVAGHLGAAARSFVRTASRQRPSWALVAGGCIGALVVALLLWRTGASRQVAPVSQSVVAATPAPPPVATPEPTAAPTAVVAIDTPTPTLAPIVQSTPAPTLAPVVQSTPEPAATVLTPEPTPAATPPPLVEAATPERSGLDGLEGTPSDSPAATALAADASAPSPSPTAEAAEAETPAAVAASPSPTTKSSSAKSSSRTRRSSRPAPTPAPNFFQKLFGIKPKPTPRKSH